MTVGKKFLAFFVAYELIPVTKVNHANRIDIQPLISTRTDIKYYELVIRPNYPNPRGKKRINFQRDSDNLQTSLA